MKLPNSISGPKVALGHTNVVDLQIINHGTPSWQRYGEGCAVLSASRHMQAGWVSINLEERSDKSSRKTFITLAPEQAAALAQLLTGELDSFPKTETLREKMLKDAGL